jgi:hypothetical protein
MEYLKPQLTLAVAALWLFRSQGIKGPILPENAGPDSHPSTGAYEADE